MKTRNRIIVALILIGVVLLSVTMSVRSKQFAKEEAYDQAQQEATTHDLQSILPYKNEYMGNASNNINLFCNLPLSDLKRSYSQDPKTFTFEVHFEGKSTDIEKNRLKKEVLYSSTAAFALIDNLQVIRYSYTDITYIVKRSDIENLYGNLQDLLNESSWHTMQEKLKNADETNDAFLKAVAEE